MSYIIPNVDILQFMRMAHGRVSHDPPTQDLRVKYENKAALAQNHAERTQQKLEQARSARDQLWAEADKMERNIDRLEAQFQLYTREHAIAKSRCTDLDRRARQQASPLPPEGGRQTPLPCDCPFCLQTFDKHDMQLMPCTHASCKPCFSSWRARREDQPKCPLCQTDVPLAWMYS